MVVAQRRPPVPSDPDAHPERVPDIPPGILHPFRVLLLFPRFPVVFAMLRPPATVLRRVSCESTISMSSRTGEGLLSVMRKTVRPDNAHHGASRSRANLFGNTRSQFRIRKATAAGLHVIPQVLDFCGGRNRAGDRRMRDDKLEHQLRPTGAINF